MKKSILMLVIGLTLVFSTAAVEALPINQVSPASLTGTGLITFDDVAGGPAPGANYDAVFESNGADFGERFVGQANTPSGNHDVLSGSPSGALSLAVGAAGQNLNVFDYSTNVLSGLGPLGFPDFNAIGEGSFAVLFDFDQSEFGFDLVGGDGGNAYISFFMRSGTLIDQITLSGLSNQSYAFLREGGITDIAGISIYNDDGGGIGFDNLKHDVPGVPGPSQVPEPSTLLLLSSGLVGLTWLRKRFKGSKV